MFWEIISKMKSDDNVKHNGEQLDDLPQKAEKYINYFKNLYSAKGAAEDHIGSVFKSYLRSDQRSENIMKHLNSPIKCEEVVNGIKKLKLGKAAGIDLIMNEFLKAGSNVLAKPITKLFNHILSSHSYPEQWSVNILSTIHKGGSKDNLDNYRGISVSSCFAKLYGAVLSSRLEKTISEFDLIGSNQIGFLKGHRTSDHIFVVNLLINKVVKKLGKALYTAFIDLRKAYDTINRNYLFSKLWSFGFEGEVLYSLQSMYKCVYQRIKLQNNLLEPVASELGLRQGCNLSPLLFNLFIEDIKFEFDAKCDQVCLADKQLSHLLYADDLLLISTSQSGLQRCLDKIQAYFSRSKLSVNLKKSNIMVFNKTGKIPKHLLFRIGKDQVDFATRYKYLGTLLSSSGSYKPAIENLNEKSRKAYFSLLTILKNIDFDQGVCLKIFDTAIKPILTYNSEIWTQLSPQQIKIFRKIENVTGQTKFIFESLLPNTDTLHLKMCKSILGVNRSCSNLAVFGELGRLPMVANCIKRMLLFFHRLISLSDDSLLANAAIESISLHEEGKFSWMSSALGFLKALGIDPDISRIKNLRFSTFKRMVSVSLKNCYERYWAKNIKDSTGTSNKGGNKLRTYAIFKRIFHCEPYTKLSDKESRRWLAKFRCSDHSLRIETGRRQGLKPEERICLMCDNMTVEDEFHFLISCPKYDQLRLKLFKYISEKVPNFDNLPQRHKFTYILSCENMNIIRRLVSFLKDAFASRSAAEKSP